MPRTSDEWQNRLNGFLDTIFEGTYQGETAPCPCPKCLNMSFRTCFKVQRHLVTRGFHESFIQGGDLGDDEDEDSVEGLGATGDGDGMKELISSLIQGAIRGEIISTGEEPNERAKKFFRLLKEAEKELYPECKEATKISFIVRLFQIKCMHVMSNSALGAILHLFSMLLLEGHCIPNTLDKVQKVVRDLGLDYQKIHACANDCVLFRKDYEMDKCLKCGECRWKMAASDEKDEESSCGSPKKRGTKRVPRKILRYFPLTPRLERLYMRECTSSQMRWHKEGLVNDDKMRHPADSMGWKHVDNKYPKFASDVRNVRLRLASDGFNPFGMLNVTYTA
jgi:hypothetical protein